MAKAKVGRSEGLVRRRRTPRGERTLQHQSLPKITVYRVDTLLWAQMQRYDRAVRLNQAAEKPTKDQIYDAAVREFLDLNPQGSERGYPAASLKDERVTFWVDSALSQQVRRIAERHGVPSARVMDAAISAYAQLRVTDELIELRERSQDEASALLKRVEAQAESVVARSAARRNPRRR